MTLINQRLDWIVVKDHEFEDFLGSCPDYIRIGYSNATQYCFRHNDEVFAQVFDENGVETVRMNPKFMDKTL